MNDSIQDQVLGKLDALPPMPRTVAEVMRMSRSENFSASDLAEVVCRDAVLASAVLRLCNSGLYALSQDVTSIQKAVLLLGFEVVKNMVFSSFVHGVIREDLPGYAQTAESLWSHCLGAATASVVVAGASAPELSDAAYTAGLIHDVGKVVMATLVAGPFLQVVDLVRRQRVPFLAAEQAVLGTTHAEVGELVAERWSLSPSLRDVIRNHHDPSRSTVEPRLSAIVRLADGLCGMLGVGAGLDATDAELDEWSLGLLGLEGERLQGVLDRATGRLFELQGRDLA